MCEFQLKSSSRGVITTLIQYGLEPKDYAETHLVYAETLIGILSQPKTKSFFCIIPLTKHKLYYNDLI